MPRSKKPQHLTGFPFDNAFVFEFETEAHAKSGFSLERSAVLNILMKWGCDRAIVRIPGQKDLIIPVETIKVCGAMWENEPIAVPSFELGFEPDYLIFNFKSNRKALDALESGYFYLFAKQALRLGKKGALLRYPNKRGRKYEIPTWMYTDLTEVEKEEVDRLELRFFRGQINAVVGG